MGLRNIFVNIVDDDLAVNDSLKWLVESIGLSAKIYSDSGVFLESFRPQESGCILLDVRMPKVSGLEVQETLNKRNVKTPIIFMTSFNDARVAVQAMKAGALDFLMKPFSEQKLLDLINKAVSLDTARRKDEDGRLVFMEKLRILSKREHQVLECIAIGMLNKNIAAKLFISSKTVEAHRANIMHKLETKTFAELIHKITVCKYLGDKKACIGS